MSLSCSCDTDGDDYAWWYVTPEDYTTLLTKRRRRCSSCNTLINIGTICTKFERSRRPQYEVEERIWGGDDVPIAPMYHCEECADMYFNLKELGFECIAPDEDVRKLVMEYQAVYLKADIGRQVAVETATMTTA